MSWIERYLCAVAEGCIHVYPQEKYDVEVIKGKPHKDTVWKAEP